MKSAGFNLKKVILRAVIRAAEMSETYVAGASGVLGITSVFSAFMKAAVKASPAINAPTLTLNPAPEKR